MAERFAMGRLVALRVDPTRTGPVVEVLPAVGGTPRYRVFLSPTDQPVFLADQLVAGPAPSRINGLPEVLDRDAFLAHLTAVRLRHPQSDHLYSLRAARIRHVPFQYKPLLRLLRADRHRLLIADEVGVGKTIEAGLILRELQARRNVQRVLIMCPKALVTKWQTEMRRFDERFRILTGPQLRYCLSEVHLEGEWPEEFAKSILPYELGRREEYLDGVADRRKRGHGLKELDPAPSFDLVIADEAHHVRNPDTSGYDLADTIQQLAEAVVFLSATPVQTSSKDLFNLLHLLRSDLFPSFEVFTEQLEPNRHVGEAIRALRNPQEDGATRSRQAGEALEAALATTWGRRVMVSDPLVQAVRERLTAPLDDLGRVATIRDLEEVHTLATVMNRTRRRDIGKFTIREPHTQRVALTRPQQQLYDEVVKFRAELLLEEHDPFVVRFVLPNIERQAASSVNALAANVHDFLTSKGFDPDRLTDDPEGLDYDVPVSAIDLTGRAARVLARAAELPAGDDPKVAALDVIVADALEDRDGPGKVLVFSYFIHTVNYVADGLRNAGYRVGVIHGGVEEEERQRLRDRFRLDRTLADAVDVLVSSEVGCEGLDFEFCDRLVNFDIPWNPMRVEQRIGRIDRYGQAADKVLIHNLVTEGTVEDRVWMRCFERLGIFRETIGDLEEVLGRVTTELEAAVKNPDLSPEQAAERALQLADNALRVAEEQRRLESESVDLFALGDAFAKDVEDARDGGNYVTADQLHQLVAWFLSSRFKGRLWPQGEGLFSLRLNAASRQELKSMLRGRLGIAPAWARFAESLEVDDLLLTFDDDVAAAQRGVEFVTPVHPLAALATESVPTSAVGAALTVSSDDFRLPVGRYEFLMQRWETIAARPEQALRLFACDETGCQLDPELTQRLRSALEHATSSEETETVLAYEHALLESADGARRRAVEGLKSRNNALVDRRLGALDRDFERRRAVIERQLAATTDERIERMRQAQLRRAADDYTERRQALEAARDADIVTSLVAVGTITVEPG